MTFRKRSLSAITRKKKVSLLGKAFLGVGIGALLAAPRFAKGFFQKKSETKKKRRKVFFAILAIFAILCAFFWTELGQDTAKKGFFALGAELPKDKDGFTNILLLGHGGSTHGDGRGAKLMDSMIVASVDAAGRDVVMLSIPRDFWDDTYETRINKIVEVEAEKEFRRLRQLPENAEILKTLSGQARKEFEWKLDAEADEVGKEHLRGEIANIFGITIHRVATIDFVGFEKIIDAIGGLDITVEKALDDPTYPDGEWGYEHFQLAAGRQILDGKTALKYARSRHSTSDFDRAARQQKVLAAIKEKALSLGLLGNPSKISEVLSIVQSNFQTNISWEEMITLAKIASTTPRENILSFVLHDDPSRTGGFLVTPSRELYGGAFVLVPFLNLESDKYAQIRAFVKTIFENRDIALLSPPKITILNATKMSGLAGELRMALERYGWNIAEVKTAEENEPTTTIRFTDTIRNRNVVDLLLGFLSAKIEAIPVQESSDANIPSSEIFEIVIGSDFQKPYRTPDFSENKNDETPL